jgi:dihydroflavonol-4-reductase
MLSASARREDIVATIDPKSPILVTGATGYVAGWLVKILIERGHTVHAAVRDPASVDKRRHLDALAAKGPGKIVYFKADLLDQGSFADGMKGCELVYHTASPFTTTVKDPVKELIEPAQLGTRNVLGQATATGGVKRVVVTSSCAAIYGDNADLQRTPRGVFDEEAWNTSSSVDHQAYSYSKTLAEREAWKLAGEQSAWDLVTMNPCLVMGPGVSPTATSESFAILRQFGDGTLKMGAPRLGMGIVDVRDLAEAHYKGGFTPAARGRYVIRGHDSDLFEIGTVLRPQFGSRYPIPKRAMPKWLLWMVGPLANKTFTRKVVSLNVDLPWRGDSSKGVRELGLTYRPLQQTLVEMFQQMIDTGTFERRKG